MNCTRNIQIIILYLLNALIIIPSVFSLDWPSPFSTALSNFAFNDRGTPNRGIIFATDASVYACETGELIFVYTDFWGNTTNLKNIDQHRNRTLGNGTITTAPLGTWLAIQHRDGLIGIYSNVGPLDTEAVPHLIDTVVPIAQSGSTGWTGNSGFRFSIFDSKNTCYINPEIVINAKDTKAPIIRQVTLAGKDNQKYSLSQIRTIRQGIYKLFVDAIDVSDLAASSSKFAPYQIRVFVNGVETGYLFFDTISTKNGSHVISLQKQTLLQNIFQQDGTYFIDNLQLNRGKTILEIIVVDASGNQRTAQYQIIVE
ncbi:MAG: hypothetical protein SNJ56_00215 [Termitinemataceae bacterium]